MTGLQMELLRGGGGVRSPGPHMPLSVLSISVCPNILYVHVFCFYYDYRLSEGGTYIHRLTRYNFTYST